MRDLRRGPKGDALKPRSSTQISTERADIWRLGADLADMPCGTIRPLTCTNANYRRPLAPIRPRSELPHNPSVVGSSPPCPPPADLRRCPPRLGVAVEISRLSPHS